MARLKRVSQWVASGPHMGRYFNLFIMQKHFGKIYNLFTTLEDGLQKKNNLILGFLGYEKKCNINLEVTYFWENMTPSPVGSRCS